MLKKSASGVLVALRASPYRSIRPRLFARCGLSQTRPQRVNNRTVTMNAEETIVSLFIVHRSPYSVSRLADIFSTLLGHREFRSR